MNERYWEAGYPPVKLVDELSAWVDKNVCEAIDNSWEHEENNPIGWIAKEDGELIIVTSGPERFVFPDIEDDPEMVKNPIDIYKIKLNLMSCLQKYGYNSLDDDEADKKERALMLRDLAKKALELADKLE